MKKILSILLAFALILGVTPVFAAEMPIQVILDGEPMEFDVPPQIIDNRTMVPMRAIFEALGAEVEWNGEYQSVLATTVDGVAIVLFVGDRTMYVATPYQAVSDIELDVPPTIVNNRTLVPLRAVSEALGADVEWDEDTRTVTILSREAEEPTEPEPPTPPDVPELPEPQEPEEPEQPEQQPPARPEPPPMMVGSMVFFDSVSTVLNENDERVLNVRFWQEGELISLQTHVRAVNYFDGFTRGTAFRYHANMRGEITEVARVFSLSNVSARNEAPSIDMNPAVTNITGANRIQTWRLENRNPRMAEVRITFAPVERVSGNTLRVGPTTLGGNTPEWWSNNFYIFRINNDANVYTFDGLRSAAQQWRTGDVSDIRPPDSRWALNDVWTTQQNPETDAPFFAAPVFEARDWVVIVEVDRVVTDMIVIRETTNVTLR